MNPKAIPIESHLIGPGAEKSFQYGLFLFVLHMILRNGGNVVCLIFAACLSVRLCRTSDDIEPLRIERTKVYHWALRFDNQANSTRIFLVKVSEVDYTH